MRSEEGREGTSMSVNPLSSNEMKSKKLGRGMISARARGSGEILATRGSGVRVSRER